MIFGPLARHFRFPTVFVLIAYHFRLVKRIFVARARHFLRYFSNSEAVPCQSRLDLAISVPVAGHFCSDLTIFEPVGCYFAYILKNLRQKLVIFALTLRSLTLRFLGY